MVLKRLPHVNVKVCETLRGKLRYKFEKQPGTDLQGKVPSPGTNMEMICPCCIG